MVDTSKLEGVIAVEKVKGDIVAITLVGYTPYPKGVVPLKSLGQVLSIV